MSQPQARADQIEFRWLPQFDFGPIAASNQDDAFRQVWFPRLKKIAAVTEEPRDGVSPAGSLVHIVFDNDTAAVIWRTWQPNAKNLGNDGKRNALVARALVGTIDVVTPELALALAISHLPAGLGYLPGQVAPTDILPMVYADELEEITLGARDRLNELARAATGLGLFISATLREPGTPLSVLLPDRYAAKRPEDGPQAGLLWGLHSTTGALLTGDFGRPVEGWKWSFSTYEPPHRENDQRSLPHVTFRRRHLEDSAPPSSLREETIVRPYDGAEQSGWAGDLEGRVGDCLALAYRELGQSGLDPILKDIATRFRNLKDRLGAVLTEPQLAGYRQPAAETEPPHQAIASKAGTGAPAADAQGPYQRHPAEPTRADIPAHSAHPPDPRTGTPRFTGGEQAGQASVWAEATSRNDRDDLFFALYQRLGRVRGRHDFADTVAWISARAARDETLPAADWGEALGLLSRDDWYIADLHEQFPRFQVVERLADLLYPVLAERLREEHGLAYLDRWFAGLDTPHEVLQAIAVISARVDKHTATAIQHRVLPWLVKRPVSALVTAGPGDPPQNDQTGQPDEPKDHWSALRWPWRLPPTVASIALVIMLLEALAIIVMSQT
jgi:hypothetical protein